MCDLGGERCHICPDGGECVPAAALQRFEEQAEGDVKINKMFIEFQGEK